MNASHIWISIGFPLWDNGGNVRGVLLNIDNTECIYIEVSIHMIFRFMGFIGI
jgi:hypothetical protein